MSIAHQSGRGEDRRLDRRPARARGWRGHARSAPRLHPADRAGLAFGVVTLILLIGSINYMLQLGYLLTFLVASMAVVGMHNTHSNLAQIVLRGVRCEPVYAGDVARVRNQRDQSDDRRSLRAALFAFEPSEPCRSAAFSVGATVREREQPTITIELPARGLRTVAVPLPAPLRGRLPAPRMTIETRYPFGLWRAWAYLTPALTAMVYPAPEFDAPPVAVYGLAERRRCRAWRPAATTSRAFVRINPAMRKR